MIERADPREFFGFFGRAGVAGERLAEQAEIVVGEQRAGPARLADFVHLRGFHGGIPSLLRSGPSCPPPHPDRPGWAGLSSENYKSCCVYGAENPISLVKL